MAIPLMLTVATFGMAFGVILLVSGLLRWPTWAHAATLTSTNVEPADLHAGATSTVTASFTTTSIVPPGGKVKIIFPAGFSVSGASDGVCSGIDGTFTTAVSGQTVILVRQGDGTPLSAGSYSCTVAQIVNPNISGTTGTYTVLTTTAVDGILDSDNAVAADVLVAGVLGSVSVLLSDVHTGVSTTATITMTTVNPIEATGSIAVVFPLAYTVSGASGGTCSGMDGSFTTNISSQTVSLVRSGGSLVPAGTYTCTVSGIVNPTVVALPGSFIVRTLNPVARVHDADTAVVGPTISASALLSTNVEPVQKHVGIFTPINVSFTTANILEFDGIISVLFPQGFIVQNASSATCASMDGVFSVSVSGLTVSLTRSGGTNEPAGAQSCTIAGIRNPALPGASQAYQIVTKNAGGFVHDSDTSVTADVFTRGSSLLPVPPNVPVIPATLVFGSLAQTVTPGAPYLINWTSSGSVDSMRINVWHSEDGGTTWAPVVGWTENDGAYIWDVPGTLTSSVTLRLVLSDLVVDAATVDSSVIPLVRSGASSNTQPSTVADVTSEDSVPTVETTTPTEEGQPVSEGEQGSSQAAEPLPWIAAPVAFVRTTLDTTVYAIDATRTRHAFLDPLSFFTYQQDFSEVNIVAPDVLFHYPLGAPMTPAPGAVLMKSVQDPRVYALEVNAAGETTLRWVANEGIAIEIFGEDWHDRVIDVSEYVTSAYLHGPDILTSTDFYSDLTGWMDRRALEDAARGTQ